MARGKVRINRGSGEEAGDGADGLVASGTGKSDSDVQKLEAERAAKKRGGESDGKSGEYIPGTERGEPGQSDGGAGRKRRKYKRRARPEASPENLTKILLTSHVMLAKLLDAKEFLLNEKEADNLAEAITRINALYDTEWISEELTAWINLCAVMGTIYVPRWWTYSARVKIEKREQEPVEVPFRTVPENSEAKPS